MVSQEDQEKLIHAFISSRVDYWNGLVTRHPKMFYSSSKIFTLASS